MTARETIETESMREQVRYWIEEATGRLLPVDDSLPDTLIARAQELGMPPGELRLWIYDQPKIEERGDWGADAIER